MVSSGNEVWWIYSTFPNRDEALSAARKLLERKLIACANLVDNVTSLYHWEGALQQEMEVAMIAKTARHEAAISLLKESHPYELPCIVALPLAGGHAPFLQWVRGETEPG